MESSDQGIDAGGRALTLLLAFVGDSAEQNRVFFRVKGKKLFAAATAKNRSIELEGVAAEGSEEGEWPVDGAFIRKLSNLTVNGSKKVPAVNARLLLERTGVSRADLVMKESGERVDTLQHHAEMPANKQLTFQHIHRTIDVDFAAAGGSWFPLEKSQAVAITAVLAAVKGIPLSFAPGSDEHSPLGFEAKGEDFIARGIFVPPAVLGPGRAATNPEKGDDDGDEDDDPKQPGLPFGQKAKGTDDGAVIEDDEADRIKAAQGGKAPKKSKRKQKNPAAGSR